MTIKPQTKAQRLANPVWLRGQIHELIKSCDANIKEDQDRANQSVYITSARYSASADSHRHWKRQLERILTGTEINEDLDETDDDALDENNKCVKCGFTSGNDWSQCGGMCPQPASPHFQPAIKARTPKKPDRREGDRRASKRRLDDKSKAVRPSTSKGSPR